MNFVIIFKSLWQLREAICHFSHKSVYIIHAQNIICSKTCLDST